MPHISLRPEPVFTIIGFTITNSLLLSYIVLALFTLFAYTFYTQVTQKKDTWLVFIMRQAVGMLYTLFESLMKDKIAIFFPLLGAFFFYIVLSNWSGLIPGVGSILIREAKTNSVIEHAEKTPEHDIKVPLFRAPTADLNTTFALALVSVFFIQFYGIKYLGFKYPKKFINLKSPIHFGLGLIEIISEFSRILSFAFRLFGNVFAGEVLLVIVASLIPIVASFPFLMLELFVGAIQALVFSMLTAVFLSNAIAHHED